MSNRNFDAYKEGTGKTKNRSNGNDRSNDGFNRIVELIKVLTPIILGLFAFIPTNSPNEPYNPVIIMIIDAIQPDPVQPVISTSATPTNIPQNIPPTPTNISQNIPRIISASTNGNCPRFNGSVLWEDEDGDIDYITVSWGLAENGERGEFPSNYTIFSNEISGTWTDELNLSCVNPSNHGCNVQFQAFDKSGNASNLVTKYHTCP